MNIIGRIQKKTQIFTLSQKQLADYIIHNSETAAFMSINELAKATNISEATIFRFTQTLEYDGYQDFIKQLRGEIQNRLSAGSLFDLEYQDQQSANQTIFNQTIHQEISNLGALQNIDYANITSFINKLANAQNILVIGLMASGSIAHYYASQLSRIFPHVRLITATDIFSSSALSDVNKNSVVINLAFPRYPLNIQNFARTAKEKGGFCITVTNSHQSPTVEYADIAFIVQRNRDRWLDSFAAPMVLLHAVLAEFGKQYPDRIRQALKEYDNYVKEFDLFSQ